MHFTYKHFRGGDVSFVLPFLGPVVGWRLVAEVLLNELGTILVHESAPVSLQSHVEANWFEEKSAVLKLLIGVARNLRPERQKTLHKDLAASNGNTRHESKLRSAIRIPYAVQPPVGYRGALKKS